MKIPPIENFDAEITVSPQGDDAGDGQGKPVATLTRARDLVRELRARGVRGPIAVNILPGEYRMTETVTLTAEDSGTAKGPTVYRAAERGKAAFYGGQRLKDFQQVADASILGRLPEESRGHVVQCDLKAQGVSDLGRLVVRGFGQPPAPPTLEVFFGGKPMTLARWPNQGFVFLRRVLEGGDRAAGKPSVFEYLDDRHARWTAASNAWLFGYFRYLWADATIQVSHIDPKARTVTCREAYRYGGGTGGMDNAQGIQYYAFNLLEELDQPGEWYLDRKSGLLYLYPLGDLKRAAVEIGMLTAPMLTANGVSDIRLEGLTFDLARGDGLVLKDCRRALLAGCTVRRMAGNGVSILGGQECGLLGCDVETIGRRAVEIIGGERATLTPGRHFVENCRIHDFGRIDRTYTPAVQLEGVGNRACHNLMYDGPSSAMRIEGNDHVIEYNDVHSVVRESDDQGAMEAYYNPSYRGIVFRYNRFVNCGRQGMGPSACGQAAIRFDDAISGMLVYGNVFIHSANARFGAVQINGGRDNIIENNLFVDCRQGVSGGWYAGSAAWRELAAGNAPDSIITSDLYLGRYPQMATMLKQPGINTIRRNVFYHCGPVATGDPANLDLADNRVFDNENPGFLAPEAGDFRVKPGSELASLAGFQPIPVEKIGLYQDAWRATWPVQVSPSPLAPWRHRLEAPAVRGRQLDGDMADWSHAAPLAVNAGTNVCRMDGGIWLGPQDASCEIRAAYDDKRFYLAIDVTDDIIDISSGEVFRRDGVELYWDAAAEVRKVAQAGWGHVVLAVPGEGKPVEPKWSMKGLPEPKGFLAACRRRPGGYVMKVSIPLEALNALRPGNSFRLDVKLNDTDGKKRVFLTPSGTTGGETTAAYVRCVLKK